MSVRTKTQRRLRFVAISLLLVLLLGAGAYFVRKRQISAQVLANRDLGYAALDSKDYFTAMHKIGPYLQRNRNDAEALFKYAQARQNVPEPNSRHISDALSFYRQLLELDPNHEDGRRLLLDLYVQFNLNTEILETTANRQDLPSQRARIIALQRLRRFDEALPLALEYTQQSPFDVQYQALTLDLMAQAGKSSAELIDRMGKLVEAHPGDARIELLQSIAYGIADDRDNALTWARRAASHPVDDPEFVKMLVAHLDGLQCFEEARKALEQAADGRDGEQFRIAAIRRLLNAGEFTAVIDQLSAQDPATLSVDSELVALRAIALIQLDRRAEATPLLRSLADRKGDPVAGLWARVIESVFAEPPQNDKQIITACREAIQHRPGNPYFHFYLAEAYTRSGDEFAALRALSAAHELARAWPAPLNNMARALLARNRPRLALEIAQAGRDRAPDDPAVLNTLAIAMTRTLPSADSLRVADVFALLDRIEQLAPRDTDSRVLRVSLLAQLDRKEEAVAALDACLAIQPPLSATALLQLASISRAGELSRESQCYAACEKAFGITSDLALAQAVAAASAGDPKRGLELLESARKKSADPQTRDWQLAWARYLDFISDPRAAEQTIALANARPDDPVIQQFALSATSVQGDRAFLRSTIDRLGAIIGDDGIAWRVADAQWLLAGEPSEADLVKATVILNDVSRRAPEHVQCRRMLAECLARLGKTDDAIEQLTAATTLEPWSNAILLRLAALMHSKGDFDSARPILTQIRGNLNSPRGRESGSLDSEWRALAVLYTERGDIDEAISVLEARGSASTQPAALDAQLAALYARTGRLTEEYSQKLLQNNDPGAIAIAADFYASQDQKSQAEQVLAMLDEMRLPAGAAALIRAQYYQRHGTPEQALEQLQAATKAAPGDPRSWRALIRYQLVQGQGDKALETVRQAQTAIPADDDLAQLARHSDVIAPILESPVARALVVAMLEQEENQTVALDALRLMNTTFKDQSTVAQTLPKLQALADRAPRLLPLQQLLATTYLATGQSEDALKVATRAMNALPNEPEPAHLAAQALAVLGRWAESLSAAEQWKKRLGRDDPEADAMLAMGHLAMNNPSAAERDLQPHVQLALSDPEKHATLIRLYLQSAVALGKLDEAASTVAPILPKSREVRIGWMQVAGAQITDPQKGAVWLQQVEPSIGSSVGEQMTLAQAWFMVAQRSSLPAHATAASLALERASRDLSTAPRTTAEDWAGVAMLYDAAGKPDAAEPAYRKALELRADFAEVQNNLAMILCNRNGDLNEALALATKAAAHRDHPLRSSFLDTLATAQAKSKQFDLAVASLDEAIKLDPANLKWRVNLALILREDGQLDRARTVLAEIEHLAAQSSQVTTEMREQIASLKAQLK